MNRDAFSINTTRRKERQITIAFYTVYIEQLPFSCKQRKRKTRSHPTIVERYPTRRSIRSSTQPPQVLSFDNQRRMWLYLALIAVTAVTAAYATETDDNTPSSSFFLVQSLLIVTVLFLMLLVPNTCCKIAGRKHTSVEEEEKEEEETKKNE